MSCSPFVARVVMTISRLLLLMVFRISASEPAKTSGKALAEQPRPQSIPRMPMVGTDREY